MTYRTYLELSQLDSFADRYEYLRLEGIVSDITFGGGRFLNQILYSSHEWKSIRQKVIFRDEGYDLAHPDHMIRGPIYIHHLNPITKEDILERRPCVFDLNNLVCCSFQTHNAIHYGTDDYSLRDYVPRKLNDTCPWKE